jgi:polyhydroxybutyrate depolymerase
MAPPAASPSTAASPASPVGGAPIASESAASAPSGAPSPTPSGAPSPTPSVTAAAKTQPTVKVGDDERLLDLFTPTLDPGERAPLVVLLHPLGGSPTTIIRTSRMDVLAARERVIVAVPHSIRGIWDSLVPAGQPITPSRDIAYLDGLIDWLLGHTQADPRRVFVAGFSMGAVLADRVACQLADKVAAVAIDSGTPWSDECSPARPVSVLILHGSDDGEFPISEATRLAVRWRELDGCSAEPASSSVGSTGTATIVDGCRHGTGVELVRVEGAGHLWFTDPDATELAWQFFAAHPRGG